MTGPSGALGRHRSMAMLAIAAALVLAVGASLFMLRTPVPPPQTTATAQPAWRAGIRQRGVARIPSKASSRSWR